MNGKRRRFRLSVSIAVVLGGALAGVLLLTPAAQATVFSNPGTITLPDPNCTDPDTATPYPSNISVAGLSGTVTDVNVTLNGVTHPFEGDIEILLVGPGGGAQNLELLSDAGTGSLSSATVTFDDSAAAQAPQGSAWGPGTYKPSNYTELSGADTFPAPAPAPSANTTLAAAFNGITPNGTWSLYVIDDACPDAGSIGGGWSLDITTAAAAATMTSVVSSLNPSRTGQSVTFTATVMSSGSPVTTGTVTFTDGPTTLAANVAVNGSGQAAFSTSTLTEGTHNIQAAYNATLTFGPSSGTVNQRVDNNTTVNGNTYCNTGAVTINDNGPATPYPSNVFVTGAGSNPSKVTATLKNVTHTFDGDIEALLVGPGGQNLVILSDAGTAGIINVTVTFDDAAASLLPQAGSWAAPNSTISAKPTNYNELVADNFPAPAPSPSVATTLATFNGVNPNGTWSLYVLDDAGPDSGSIGGGWCLTLTTTVTPTLTTDASAGGLVGIQLNDVATLSGGNSPTGTITFDLYGPDNATCAGPPIFTSTKTVSGNGNYTSDSFTTTSAGTYRWRAGYSGDANNNAVSPTACLDPNESAVVTAAVATIATQATPTVTIGGPISDTATVTGAAAPAPAPTGTVVFTLFGPNNATCTGAPIFTSAAQPLAGGPPPTANSGLFTPSAVGTYRWVAAYSGDANYSAVTSACNAPDESSVVSQAAATIATQATPSVVIGSPISDTATVTGTAAPAPAPTGTVAFTLFGPNNATCTGAPIFTSAAQPLAGGPPPTANSGPFTPSAVGTYRWVAAYSGDANYSAVTSACNAPDESSVVNKASPTIATQASVGGALGTSVNDVATVSGGVSPTGTVTFRLFSNSTCTTQVFTSTNPVGAGGVATSGSFTPASVGTYRWTAIYNGDARNNTALSACNAPNESVTIVKASPTISTQASAGTPVGTAVNDVATVSGGVSPTGTVTFRLFNNSACTTQVFTSTNPLVAGKATSANYTATAAGKYYWTAVYNGDAKNNTATSPCSAPNESVVVSKATPIVSTTASPGVLEGGSVHDTATLSNGFNPTGTVTFRLFSNAACTTQVFTSTNAVAGGTATSGNFTPAVVGTYFWTAVYSGDTNNNAATSPCNAPNESVVVRPFAPPPCTRTLTGDVTGPITVNAGETVCVDNARVIGPITVNPGGALTVANSQVSGGIVASQPAFFSLCNSQVAPPTGNPAQGVVVTNANVPLRIGDPAKGCALNKVMGGDVTLTGNTAGLTLGANQVSGKVTVSNNTIGSVVVKANTIGGALGCTGNNPPPTNAGQPNTAAGGKTGQCAAL